MLIKVITTSVWAVCGLVTILFHVIGCDYQSDKIISDQSAVFEDELDYRQKVQYELENRISKQQVQIAELKKELDCRKEAKND
jgi:hypothetical protein